MKGAVLTSPNLDSNDNTPRPALVLPLDTDQQRLLLQAAQNQTPLTPLQLLRLNAYAVNRDQGLFDQLPYALWTVDSDNQWKDAAGNPVTQMYHGGKRQAYQWFLGKDWDYYLTQSPSDTPTNDNDTALQLKQRIAQLQIQELEMELADLEQQCAVAFTQGEKERLGTLQAQRNRVKEQLESSKEGIETSSTSSSNEISTDISKYTSPYDMYRDLLRDQMKAEVIATVLENTSFLDGNTVLGGALVLRRIVATQQVNILGETLQLTNETENYGNPDQAGGTVLVIECHADEAIGMSLSCDLPCQMDYALWQKASVMVSPSLKNGLREWMLQDSELSVLVEGEGLQNARSERALPVRIPRTRLSLFDQIVTTARSFTTNNNNTTLFPTDNPVQSLEQYDALNTQDKVRTLLGLSSFNGRLPRPRIVRANPTALDDLLLPLIDESVRRQYRIRDAERRGDTALVEALLAQKSRRQAALEKAQTEQENATYWTEQAELLSSLRADPTQDEGSYSRFLDRDEWYERQRQEQAKRVNRSQFGSLLDGIE